MKHVGERGLGGFVVYNPALLSEGELKAQFVARRPLFDRLIGELRNETFQHHVLIGPRGMGKTMLLRRIKYAVEDDRELAQRWIALTFPEEQYNVAHLSDFYVNCVDALADALDENFDDALERLPDDEQKRAESALDILRAYSRRSGRRILLLVDNFDLILDRVVEAHWGFREVLSHDRSLVLIGTSSAPIEATFRYDAAFFDFFYIHELRELQPEETKSVLLALAKNTRRPDISDLIERDPGRIRALHELTGGNPRTTVLLFGVFAQGVDGDVRSDLERLLDQCTPLYKARFEALPAQAQQVVDGLALHWDPITAAELAARLRMDKNAVSSHLNRLVQQGVVDKVSIDGTVKTGFQIAERFFNIWSLMRASRRLRRRLIWLVELFKALFAGDVHQMAEREPLRKALESRAVHDLVGGASVARDAPAKRMKLHMGSDRERRDEGAARSAADLSGAADDRLEYARVLLARKDADGATSLAQALSIEEAPSWPLLIATLREVVASDQAAPVLSALDASRAAERWRAVVEALRAIVESPAVLTRSAPEIRRAAEEVLAQVGFTPSDRPPAAKKKRS